jgi:hypothetical protein
MTEVVPLPPATVAVPVQSAEVPDLQMFLSEVVRAGLDAKGWPQARLALEVGITQKHLTCILNGRQRGDLKVWDALLHAVGLWPLPFASLPRDP